MFRLGALYRSNLGNLVEFPQMLQAWPLASARVKSANDFGCAIVLQEAPLVLNGFQLSGDPGLLRVGF